ncbi:hypothetical protein BDZ45DRAFT_270870 [Acephala macrosclerotiorum]|nr:hypothetical protein BDZ45DRAFT_270870 [Acephala macrosclerotiorum]
MHGWFGSRSRMTTSKARAVRRSKGKRRLCQFVQEPRLLLVSSLSMRKFWRAAAIMTRASTLWCGHLPTNHVVQKEISDICSCRQPPGTETGGFCTCTI